MKKNITIAVLACFFAWLVPKTGLSQSNKAVFDFYGDSIELSYSSSLSVPFHELPTVAAVQAFYDQINQSDYSPLLQKLLDYRTKYTMDDWLYYQLIRKTAGLISPKADNYIRYTLYKWFLMTKSGYDVRLSTDNKRLLLYAYSTDNIYEIPSHTQDGKPYVCLNYHDYGYINFDVEKFAVVNIAIQNAEKAFSYKITRLPDFKPSDYVEKDLRFAFYQNELDLKVQLTPKIQALFTNYPVVDYELSINTPLSTQTRNSLIPAIKREVRSMGQKDGIDFLMRFTRYAFVFEKDTDQFGKEKRLTPEQTLLYEASDCEDRVALFYSLVKEIYNLPMIILAYPEHVSIAVKLDKPVGKAIIYKGDRYSVCEPTPQRRDLKLGQGLPSLKHVAYEVAYAYHPGN